MGGNMGGNDKEQTHTKKTSNLQQGTSKYLKYRRREGAVVKELRVRKHKSILGGSLFADDLISLLIAQVIWWGNNNGFLK